ncbi:MAG: CPBP family intramembrane glutamic endopeptidase [Thermoplasmata archaeon]
MSVEQPERMPEKKGEQPEGDIRQMTKSMRFAYISPDFPLLNNSLLTFIRIVLSSRARGFYYMIGASRILLKVAALLSAAGIFLILLLNSATMIYDGFSEWDVVYNTCTFTFYVLSPVPFFSDSGVYFAISLFTVKGISTLLIYLFFIISILLSLGLVLKESLRKFIKSVGHLTMSVNAPPVDSNDSLFLLGRIFPASAFFSVTFVGIYSRFLFIGIPLGLGAIVERLLLRRKKTGTAHGDANKDRDTQPAGTLVKYFLGGTDKIGGAEFVLILLSSLIFGLAHISGWGVWKIFPSFVMGLFLGYAYVKKGIHISILLHFSFDYAGMVLSLGLLQPLLSYLYILGIGVMMVSGCVFFFYYLRESIRLAAGLLFNRPYIRPKTLIIATPFTVSGHFFLPVLTPISLLLNYNNYFSERIAIAREKTPKNIPIESQPGGAPAKAKEAPFNTVSQKDNSHQKDSSQSKNPQPQLRVQSEFQKDMAKKPQNPPECRCGSSTWTEDKDGRQFCTNCGEYL